MITDALELGTSCDMMLDRAEGAQNSPPNIGSVSSDEEIYHQIELK